MKQTEDIKCGEDFVSGNYDILECEETLGISTEYFATYLRGKIKESISRCQDIQGD